MRTHRLLALLDHLRGHRGPVSAETLAAFFAVSIRTIYRDMATLQAIGAPVRGEAGIGYQLESGVFLPSMHFDPDELDALMLGMRLVAVRGDNGLAEAARRVSAKISGALPDDKRDDYLRRPLKAVARDSAEHTGAVVHLGRLRAAVRDGAQLRLVYVDLQERETVRIARPLGLTAFDKAWLLTIWCETRADFRNLRIDRLRSVTATGASFRPERGRTFDDYLRTLSLQSQQVPAEEGTRPHRQQER